MIAIAAAHPRAAAGGMRYAVVNRLPHVSPTPTNAIVRAPSKSDAVAFGLTARSVPREATRRPRCLEQRGPMSCDR